MNYKCKKIRELILTDYLDNEISDKDKTRLNIHFARCKDCKEFYERVKLNLAQPFAAADKANLPEFIWQNVKQAIVTEQQEKPSIIFVRRPAFAISTVMALVIIAVVMAKFKLDSQENLKSTAQGQMEYLAYSVETPVGMLVSDESGLGTSIETYFLQ